MRQCVAVAAMLMLVAPVAWAGSLEGVTMDDAIVVDGTTLHLNGMGVRKKLWVEVYVAGLYLEQKTSDAGQAVTSPGSRRVVMHFLTNKATKKKMDAAWLEGFEANSPTEFDALRDRVEQFIGLFGDMKDGDEIELTMGPDAVTSASLNGEVKGTVQGEDFGQALLRVWLGEKPPSNDLKKGLLGG